MAKIEKRATDMPHVFLCDIHDDGLLKEIAVVKEGDDGTLLYIEIDKLHPIDKARLKKIVSSQHTDKYPLWELLAQGKLNNGMNALDFFHANYVRTKRPKGAVIGGGLASIELDVDDRVIGSSFSDPRGAVVMNEAPPTLQG